MVYTMVKVDGASACALSGQMEQEKEIGVPPHWNNQVTVASADGTAGKAGELGANAGPFGWSFQAMEGAADSGYEVIRNGERAKGGVMAAHGGVRPHWLPYFATGDMEATLEAVEAGGGEKVTPVIEMPAGRIAAVRDPPGAAFAVWAGELED